MSVPTYVTTQGKGVTVGGVACDVAVWTLRDGGRSADLTTTGTGSAIYAGVVYDHTWEYTGPKGQTIAPRAMTNTTIVFTGGGTLADTLVESVELVNDATSDVQRLRVSGKGGVLTP